MEMEKLDKKKRKHLAVIADFLRYLNKITDRFILKGGTALMLCYGSTRLSEDIDLDAASGNIISIADGFIKEYSKKYNNSLSYRVGKNTDIVKRILLHYGGAKPLKIEVSYRNTVIESENVCSINCMAVYKIDKLMQMKISAFRNRDALRDLEDICFIYEQYKDRLSSCLIEMLADEIRDKGEDYFDYITGIEKSSAVNEDSLLEAYLNMCYDLEIYW